MNPLLKKLQIQKNFNDIIDFIIENECDDYTSIDELKDKYYSLLSVNAIEISRRLEFQISMKMKIAVRMDVLWVQGSKFRYYDISEADFNSLVGLLNIDSLSDVEISAKYFIGRYSKELSEFDIHDEYELHNLLRKRLKEGREVEVLRMPKIKFGKASRKKQVFELLEQESPIDANALAQKYEDLYGVRQDVFLASYVDEINIYLHKGLYRLDYPDLTEEEMFFLRDNLIEKVYKIIDIKKLFQEQFPKSDVNKVNSYTLKRLGFFICSSIAYRAERENYEAFFKSLFDEKEIVDFTQRPWLVRVSSASACIDQMKKAYEWFEFEPYKYVSLKRLMPYIDGKLDVVSYAENASRFFSGKPFTLRKLKNQGFKHKLDNLGFGDFFYISILRYADNLNYCRIGNQYVFVEFPQKVTLEKLIYDIVCEKKSLNVFYLIDLLQEEYGLYVDKARLCEKIANTTMFFSQTMEKIYIDYDEFLGDL